MCIFFNSLSSNSFTYTYNFLHICNKCWRQWISLYSKLSTFYLIWIVIEISDVQPIKSFRAVHWHQRNSELPWSHKNHKNKKSVTTSLEFNLGCLYNSICRQWRNSFCGFIPLMNCFIPTKTTPITSKKSSSTYAGFTTTASVRWRLIFFYLNHFGKNIWYNFELECHWCIIMQSLVLIVLFSDLGRLSASDIDQESMSLSDTSLPGGEIRTLS
jgi:hypothetical protein